jgi:hypothetical protein
MNRSLLCGCVLIVLSGAAVVAADDSKPVTTGTDVAAAQALAVKQFRARGFKERFRKGEIVYCRKETPLGTRFPQTLCLTEAQMVDKLKNEAELQQELGKAGACIGDKCAGN